MKSLMMSVAASVGLAGVALAGASSAQGGPPPVRSEFAPAAPTQNAPPDGGQRYDYPPNTGALVRPQDRTPYDVPPRNPRSKSSVSEPSSPTRDPSRQPATEVGR